MPVIIIETDPSEEPKLTRPVPWWWNLNYTVSSWVAGLFSRGED